MNALKIALDRASTLPLYAQLRDKLLQAITERALKPGDRLPTVVALAKQVGVTQATVLRAFEDLTQAGRISSHVGRGTFVTLPEGESKKAVFKASAFARSPVEPVDPEFALAARRLRMGIAKSLEALQVLAQRPGLIAFTSGVPDPELVRIDALGELSREALKDGESDFRGYGPPTGLPALREAIARRLDPSGKRIHAEQVLVTSGSQQAVALLAQSALERNQRIICEMPAYMGVANAFGAIGHWVESVPRDAQGPVPEYLARFRDDRPSVLYLCPQLHNPMGTDLSAERRAMIVDWARTHGAALIADEIFQDLRFEGPAPPSLLTESGLDVCAIGSLSKSFMCGLRVGWLVSSVERIRSLVALKRAADISCPPLMQGLALALLRSGMYETHLLKARAHYRLRCESILKALKRHMPEGVTWTRPRGGFHLWVDLPVGYSSIALYLLAIERGVVISPGPQLDIDHRFVPAFRLSYGALEPAKIDEGIELLADAVRKLLRDKPTDPGLSGLGNLL